MNKIASFNCCQPTCHFEKKQLLGITLFAVGILLAIGTLVAATHYGLPLIGTCLLGSSAFLCSSLGILLLALKKNKQVKKIEEHPPSSEQIPETRLPENEKPAISSSYLRNLVQWGHIAQLIEICEENKELIVAPLDNGETLLHKALTCKRDAFALWLLKNGAPPNIVNANGETPLHLAISTRKTQIIDELLIRGGDLTIPDQYGRTPLHYAAYMGDLETIKKCFGITKVNRRSLAQSIVSHHLEDGKGITPLHFAAQEGHSEVLELLLEYGGNLAVIDHEKQTPLHLAAIHGQYEIVEWLLKKGADLKTVDEQGKTPLHYAASEENELKRTTFFTKLPKLLNQLESPYTLESLKEIKDTTGKTYQDYFPRR